MPETGLRTCPPEKSRRVTAFAAEQSVLSSPVCPGRVAKYGHLSQRFRAIGAGFLCTADCVAEGEGFEPPVPFQVQRFSRPPVSTTHTSLQPIESTPVDSSPTLSNHHTESHFRVSGPCLRALSTRLHLRSVLLLFMCGTGLKRL